MANRQRSQFARICAVLMALLALAVAGWWYWLIEWSHWQPANSVAPKQLSTGNPTEWEEADPLPGKAVPPEQFSEQPENQLAKGSPPTFSLTVIMPGSVPLSYFPSHYHVKLNLRKGGGAPVAASLKAEPGGGVRFADLPFTNAFRLRCQVSMTGNWGSLFETFVLDVPEPGEYECTVPLRPGPFVMGRLVNRMGQSVAGASLELVKRDPRSSEVLLYAAAVGRSDAQGNFLLFPSGYEPTRERGMRGRGVLTAQLSIPLENRSIILGRWIEVGDEWVTELGDVVLGDGVDVEFRLFVDGVLYEGRAEITLSHGHFSATVVGHGNLYRMEGVPSLHDAGVFSWYHFYVSFHDVPNANGVGFRQVTKILKPQEMQSLRGPIEIHANSTE